MLTYEYRFYLPLYIADNHGCPTSYPNEIATNVFLHELLHAAGGYTVLNYNAIGACEDGNGCTIRETITVVSSTMSREVYLNHVAPHLRCFKNTMNQVTVYVTATPVEVCSV
jgi:hypothetical protein